MNIRRTLIGLALATATIASADTIVITTGGVGPGTGTGYYQVTGALPLFTNPPTAASTGTVSGFTAANQAAANAAIQAQCASDFGILFGAPGGLSCSNLTWTAIDLAVGANLSQTVVVTNGNAGTSVANCVAGTCTGSGANSTNGVVVQGKASLSVDDPLTSGIAGFNNAIVATLATNSVTGTGVNRKNFRTIAGKASATATGTATASQSQFTAYSDADAPVDWANEQSIYSATTVSFNVNISGSAQTDLTTGVTTTANTVEITGGNVDVWYQFTFNQTEIPATPEPMTFALVGAGLIGAALLRKRFSKQ